MSSFPEGWRGAEVVFLDCDSTLSSIEGIDELALRRGVDVAALTAKAMDGELAMDAVYRARLEQIRPSAEDFVWLAERYWQTRLPGAVELVAGLEALGVPCHVISGGLLPGVLPFAERLGIPAARVHAVPYPLAAADPVGAACAHPLSRNGGKPETVAAVCAAGPPRERRLLAGDGASDLERGLFVGFGGVEDRPAVRRAAPVYLRSEGLWAIAALAAGPERLDRLAALAPRLHDDAVRELASPSKTVIRTG